MKRDERANRGQASFLAKLRKDYNYQIIDLNVQDFYKFIKPLNDTTYLIDCLTYLLVESRHNYYYSTNDKNKQAKNVIRYSDYKMVDGVLFPHSIANLGDGLLNGTTQFTNIVVNPEIDTSFYNI